MTNDLYTEEFQKLKKNDIFINEMHNKFNMIIHEDKIVQLLTSLECKVRFLFAPSFTVIESLYLNLKHKQPFIDTKRVDSVRKQKQEILMGAISWLVILMTLFIDWKISLGIIVAQIFFLILCPSMTDFYTSILQKRFMKSIEQLAKNEGVENINQYSFVSSMPFYYYMKDYHQKEISNILKFGYENSSVCFIRSLKCKYFSVINHHELVLLLNLDSLNNEKKNSLMVEIKELLESLFTKHREPKLSEEMDNGIENILEKYLKSN